MSYEIVYGKQFIKTKDYIIPVVLMGSNNCTMYYGGREIIDRSWNVLSNNLFALTEQELKNEIQKWLGSKYQEHFKCNGKWVDDKGLVNFINTGIKKALTIEQIKESTGYSTKCYLSIWNEDNRTTENMQLISKNEDFEKWILDAKERYNNKQENEKVYFCIEWNTIKPLKAYNQDIKGKVLAKYKNRYVSSFDKGLHIETQKEKAYIFDSIEQSKELLKDWEHLQLRYVKYTKNTPSKERNFAIKYNCNYGNYYMQKHTKTKIYHTTNKDNIKQKFATIEKAKEFIENTLKYFNVTNCEIVNIGE